MQPAVQTKFDANSTADDVLSGIDLSGKLAVITGAAAGIGKETARGLAAAGADVVLGGRSKTVLDGAAREIETSAKGRVLANEMDLLSLKSVCRFANEIMALGRPVDLLVLNAGVMACPLARNAEGIESQLATNFVGHALLTSILAKALVKSEEPRVISLSSSAHQMSPVVFDDINFERRAYDPWDAYAQSKTANVLLATKVWLELGARGVTAHAVHPGGIHTGLLKHVTGDIVASLTSRFAFDASSIPVKSVAQGAATTVWAATEPTLRNRETFYLEDCHVAEILDEPIHTRGVMRYALDNGNAIALWHAAEKLIDARLPLGAN